MKSNSSRKYIKGKEGKWEKTAKQAEGRKGGGRNSK